MRALVTGLTGFAAGQLAEHLVAQGDQVLGTVRTAGQDPARPLPAGVQTLVWDLAHPPAAAQIDRIRAFAPEAVYHLAALSVPADCGNSVPRAVAWSVNVAGTERVLEIAQRLGRPRPRVLFVSTSQVYAPPEREDPRVAEYARLGPRRAYGWTKLLGERACRRACRGGLPVLIARPFQHTGPGQSPRLMLSEWARQVVENKDDPLRVIRLDSWLDLTDVRDVVRAYRRIVVSGRVGRTYNVGGGHNRRSGDILAELLEVAGLHRRVVESRPAHEQHPIADVRRIANDTGWTAAVPLRRTLEDTLAWWRGSRG